MTATTPEQLHSLKRQLHEVHAHILDAERVYLEADDGMSATRLKSLAWHLLAEIEYLDLLLAKTPLPTTVRIP
jgi:hypothetical protein